MKIINFCFFILLLATQVAFAESNFDGLIEINGKTIAKAKNSKSVLDEKIKMTLKNLPELKKSILDLEKSWKNTIEKKCHLYTFSSWGTQAQTAEVNTCLSDEYLAAADFFEQLSY